MRTPPKIALDTPIGPDVDLETEEIRLADGTRFTNEIAEEINEQALRAAGRPSLSAPGQHSPSVTVRLPQHLADKLDAKAASTGKRRSQIVREALESALAS